MTNKREKEYVEEIAEAYNTSTTEEEIVLKAQGQVITPPSTKFSDIEKDGKVNLSDIYTDARAFLDKTNFSKFVIVAFTLLLSPLLLYYGHLDAHTYREIIIIISLTYLGVDAYQNRHKR